MIPLILIIGPGDQFSFKCGAHSLLSLLSQPFFINQTSSTDLVLRARKNALSGALASRTKILLSRMDHFLAPALAHARRAPVLDREHIRLRLIETKLQPK